MLELTSRTTNVMALADTIYKTKDYTLMPVLGDAIMDTNRDNEEIVAHCQGNHDHGENCWALKMILGHKTQVPTWLDWRKVYHEYLNMGKEYDAEIEKLKPFLIGSCLKWQIPMIKGIIRNKIRDGYKKAGVRVYSYRGEDLDSLITERDRDPKNGSYVVEVLATIEADEKNKNQSANQRKQQGCTDTNFTERFFLGLSCFATSKQHLDVDNVTLCPGSLWVGDADGDVASVDFGAGSQTVYVHWSHPDGRDPHWSPRSAEVSFS